MSVRVEQASKWIYAGVWGILSRWFRVPEHPPALPSSSGTSVESFKPAIGFLKYLKFQFWVGLFAIDLTIFVVELIILVNAPTMGLLLLVPALFFAIVPDVIIYLAIHLRYDTTWYVLSDRSLRIRRSIWIIHETTITFENVQVSFAAPEEGERWTLRDAGGTQLCELPCQKWVGQSSGYYLQRERAGKKDVATVPMPPAFGYPPGSAVEATYRPERGSPFWSSMGFYFVGLPSAALGAVFLGFGLEQTISGRDCSEFRDCPLFGSAGGNLGISLFYLSFAGASFYWYLWSHEAEVEVKRPGGDARGASAVRWAGAAPSGLSSLQLSANGLRGSFW